LSAMAKVAELSWDDPDVPFFLALTHISLGDPVTALNEIKKAILMGYPAVLIAADPGFSSISENADFQNVVGIGLQ